MVGAGSGGAVPAWRAAEARLAAGSWLCCLAVAGRAALLVNVVYGAADAEAPVVSIESALAAGREIREPYPRVENRGDCCPGCCLDLAMTIEEGPLPNPVQSPEVNDSAVATLPPGLSPPSSATASRYGGHDTGPPRTDQRTDLIATTVLRE